MNYEKSTACTCCSTSNKGMKYGMAFAIPNALFMLMLGWAGWLFGYGTAAIEHTSAIYYGFNATFLGGIAGAIGGFILGFVYGYIFAMVLKFYNGWCGKYSSCSSSTTTPHKN